MPLPSDQPFGLFKYPWILGLVLAALLIVGIWTTLRMRRLYMKHRPGPWWSNVQVERLVQKISRDPSNPDQHYARRTLQAYYLGTAVSFFLMVWHIWLVISAH